MLPAWWLDGTLSGEGPGVLMAADGEMDVLEGAGCPKVRRALRRAMKVRCAWVGEEPLNREYHDREWGVPVHDDRVLFEFLILEGAQAGLSWLTILKKRESYRRVFDGFDPKRIAAYREDTVRRLLADPGIVRNELKIRGTIRNAKAFLTLQEEFGSFDRFIWQFVDGRPKQNAWERAKQVPDRTAESDAMSQALRARGFTFAGSTICYAFMQAVGLVNDHTRDCFRYRAIERAGRGRGR